MKTAAEIMNRNFHFASPTDTIGALLHEMGTRGVGTVVVLDLGGRPVGVATSAQIESCYDMEELAEGLTRPALCMDQHTPVDVAARTLALHHADGLLLLNESGVAVGALSSHDLLRAILGLNGTQLSGHPHERDVCWEEADVLELGAAHRAPEAPGIILLSPGLDATARRLVWAEATPNMRERLDQMLRNPQDDPRLEAMLDVYPRTLRFRCLTVYDADQRQSIASALCNVAEGEEPTLRSLKISGVMPVVTGASGAKTGTEP
jgi:CBS domain-containing protein